MRQYSPTTTRPVLFGTMATEFIDGDKREEINQKYAPLSVDMEPTSIAHI